MLCDDLLRLKKTKSWIECWLENKDVLLSRDHNLAFFVVKWTEMVYYVVMWRW